MIDTVEEITSDLIAAHVEMAAAQGNAAVADYLATRMHTGRGRVRWLVVIDSIDDLPLGGQISDREAAVRKYLHRARDFARTRERVQIVAIMRSVPNLEADVPVYQAEPLTDNQFRELLGSVDHPELATRIRFDPYFGTFRESPLLVQTLSALPPQVKPVDTGYDLMRWIVQSRLSLLCENNELRTSVERAAGQLAWQMAEAGNEHSVMPADLKDEVSVLQRAGLVRAIGDRCRFNHPWIRDYFGARLLIAGDCPLNLRWALQNELREEFVVSALQSGATHLVEQAVEDAKTILKEEKDGADPALPSLLTLHEASKVGLGGARWPDRAGAVMIMLVRGLCRAPGSLLGQPAISEPATQMVQSAMRASTGRVRNLALQLLPLAAPNTAADCARLILVDKEDSTLINPLLEQLAWLPNVNMQLEPSVLARTLLSNNGYYMLNIPQSVSPAAREPYSLPWRMRNVLRVGRIFAIALLLLVLYLSIDGILQSEVAYSLIFGLPAIAFLADSRVRAESGIGFVAYACGAVFAAAAALGFLAGTILIFPAVVSLFSGAFAAALKFILVAYFTTWPAAMLAMTLLDKPAAVVDWVLPQAPLVRQHFLPWLVAHVRSAWARPEVRSVATDLPTLVLVLLGIAFFIATGGRSTESVSVVDIIVGTGGPLFLFTAGLRVWRRLRPDRSQLTAALRGVIPKDIDDHWLLEMLEQAVKRNRIDVGGLLRSLSSAESVTLAKIAQVLDDLDKALEFARKVLPQDVGTSLHIPPAVFALAGPFTLPEFHDWLETFESRHPGILDWLTKSHRGLVAELADRAHHPGQ
ncbi:hypothetical protein [Saccharothrix texasensis]|nr:hypothetical protein [Saccharothrix texasensis]